MSIVIRKLFFPRTTINANQYSGQIRYVDGIIAPEFFGAQATALDQPQNSPSSHPQDHCRLTSVDIFWVHSITVRYEANLGNTKITTAPPRS